MRWVVVFIWVLLLALSAVGALAFCIDHTTRVAAASVMPRPDPHDLPMDYADPDVRRALKTFETFTLGRGLDSTAEKCSGNREIYRVTRLPGLSEDEFASVELSIAGSSANVEVRKFGQFERSSDEYGWHVTAHHAIDESEARLVRTAAENFLSARLEATDEPIIDAPETTVETCRHGRYHFFTRRGTRSDEKAFVAFTKKMLSFAQSKPMHATAEQR